MKKPFFRKTLLIAIWFLFLLALLQGAGFLFFTLTDVRIIGSYGYPAGLYVYNPSLNYLYNPGFEGFFVGAGYRDIPLRINDHGFRDDPFESRTPGRRRILFLGDSVVFGSGVREEDRFTEQLQAHEALAGGGIDVLNLGVNAYNFGHYLELARLRFMDLKPDLVVVGFTLNDIQKMEGLWPEKRFKPVKGQNRDLLRRKWYSKPDWVARVQQSLGRTYAARFAEQLMKTMKQARMSEEDLKNYSTKWMRSAVTYWSKEQNRNRLRDELRLFKEEMSRQGISFVFLLFPEKNDLLHPEEYSLPRESIIGLLDDLQINYCDAYDTFASMPDIGSLYLVNDSVHFTPAGHAVIRDALLACGKGGIVALLEGTGRSEN